VYCFLSKIGANKAKDTTGSERILVGSSLLAAATVTDADEWTWELANEASWGTMYNA
jgi:hypothetical protein